MENNNKTIKYGIILIILIIIFFQYKKSINRRTNIIYNTYNIYLNGNTYTDFKNNNYFELIPGKDCPNKEKTTLFFKDDYILNKTENKNKIKDIHLNLIKGEEQQFFTKTPNEIREKILNNFGMKNHSNLNEYNLYILPYVIKSDFIKQINQVLINQNQKINRFFNYQEYISKSLLYMNYKNMKKYFPLDYDYMLEAYTFPQEKKEIYSKFENYNAEKTNNLYLVKPSLSSVGAGITFLDNIKNITYQNYIITRYLNNPHLIRGFKYDIRFHCLISSIKPLKLYIYDEGFVRIATEKYSLTSKNKYSFLTNIYVNKQNMAKYKYPLKDSEIETSNLWNLEIFEKYCKSKGINYNILYNDVIDIFIKMVFSIRKKLISYIDNNNLHFSNFYHMIGIDIIVDENLKPYLLEANRRSSLRDDNSAEKKYTHNLIADTLNIIGIKVRKNNMRHKYSNRKMQNSLKNIIDDNLCELDRPRGGYKLIFPLKENIEKYQKYYLNDIPIEDLELWKYLKE